MNALEVRAAVSLALVYVLRMMGLFMVMPVLAVAAMDYPDYSPVLVGLAVGGYGLTQAALQIPMGMLSDRWGRKPVILFGLTVFAAGSFIAATADTLAWMIAGRILQGAGAIAGAIMALATDVSRETQRAKVMAVIGIAIGFSFYLAVLAGPLIANSWGLSGIFALTGVLAICCMPLIQWAVPTVGMQGSGDVLPQRNQLRRLLVSSQLWRLNLSVMLLHMMITLLFVQLPVTLVHFDMTLESHWMLYLPVLVASIIGLIILMAIGKGQTPRKVVMAAALMMTVAFAMLGAQDHARWVVVGAVILFFTGFNYLEASFPALVSSIAPAGEKGTAMGIYASFQFFGAFIGGVLAGVVADHWTPETAYFVGAVAASCWLLVLRGLNEVNRVKRVTFKWQGSAQASSELGQALNEVTGVQETTISVNEGMVYLKVTQQFDQDAINRILTRFSAR
ncbi:MFS transporter [Salinimonas chungwhensis]|uniref:MFS transporter n=1 Tax=Salinimonas chungwhensis TaxID=265425 RepID=UPI00037BE01A|nr:MFS transporter [Salinimonas chungwhensis]